MQSSTGIVHAGPRSFPTAALKIPLGIAFALIAGLVVAKSSKAGVALAALPFGAMLLRSAHLRLVVVVVGGVLVFDSSSGFTYTKLIYLAALVVCLGVAWRNCTQTMREGKAARIRRTAGAAYAVMVAIVTASLPVAMFNGHSLTLWLRDVAPLLLLGAAPILAADASQRVSARFLTSTFAVTGLLVTVSASVKVLQQHTDATVSSLPGLTHFVFPVTLYVYACARTIYAHKHRGEMLRWGIVATLVFAATLVSGARAGFLLLVPLLVIMIVSGGVRGFSRALMLGVAGAGAIFLALTIGTSAGIDTKTIESRLSTTLSAAQSPQTESSLGDRFAEDRVAWRVFKSAPIFGVGPGSVFTWQYPPGVVQKAFTFDGSVAIIAKYGLFGAFGLLVFFALIARLVRLADAQPERAALVGLAAWAGVYLIIGNPVEDKGLALGLLFILALTLPTRNAPHPIMTGALREDPKDAVPTLFD